VRFLTDGPVQLIQVAERAPEEAVIRCMLPDTGRYLSTPLFEGAAIDMPPEEEGPSRSTPGCRIPPAQGLFASGPQREANVVVPVGASHQRVAAVHPGDRLDDGQAEAEALAGLHARVFAAPEAIEHALSDVIRNGRPGIAHDDLHDGVTGLDQDSKLRVLGRVTRAVDEQVHECTANERSIREEVRIAGHHEALPPFLQQGLDEITDVFRLGSH
jgi:hypothetical protein